MNRLLAVFAHPDDETFLAGPILAYYAARGVAVHLCTATPQPVLDPQSTVAQRRAALACAARTLGIHRVHHLDYAEAALSRAAIAGLSERVLAVIREVQPQVVVTDAAYGSYGHPHHILMHRAALAAADSLAGDPLQPRLYALAFPMPLVRLNARVMRLLGVPTKALVGRSDLNLEAILRDDHPATVRLEVREFVASRRRAAACYAADIAAAPLPLRLLERSPLWVQQAIFGTARLTRIRPVSGPPEVDLFPTV